MEYFGNCDKDMKYGKLCKQAVNFKTVLKLETKGSYSKSIQKLKRNDEDKQYKNK